jgi:predicted Zn-dependent protease
VSDAKAAPHVLAERALEAATGPCVVLVETDTTANLRWAANTLTTNGLSSSRTVTVIATHEGSDGVSTGVVRRGGVTAEDIAGLVAEAEAEAAAGPPAEDAAPLVPGPADDTFGQEPADLEVGALQPFADALGEAVGRAAGAGQELFGYAEQSLSTVYLASTTGLRARHVQPSARAEVNGKAEARTRSAWAAGGGRQLADIDVSALSEEVETRLGWQARQLELGAGRYDTVLPPNAVADLMIYAYWSAGARTAHEGRSVFGRPGGGTRVGERLTTAPLTLSSDPAASGLECAPYVVAAASSELGSVFDNGLATPATRWVDGGVLSALPTTRYTAQLTGLPLHPYISNLSLTADAGSAGGTGGIADLVRDVDDGLLLTCLWYIREVDPRTLLLTGLTRDGVYRVQGGEVVGAVTNFRFNESPIDLLGRVDAIGASVPTIGREFGAYLPRTAMPAVRVSGFNMSSVSPAS